MKQMNALYTSQIRAIDATQRIERAVDAASQTLVLLGLKQAWLLWHCTLDKA